MRTRVHKWGNSIALRIPKSYAREIGIKANSPVNISIQGGSLVITPLISAVFSLENLMAQVTDDNLHEEVDSGRACGREE